MRVKRGKAISAVIGALILIAITVGAAFILYNFMTSQMASASRQGRLTVQYSKATWDGTTMNLTLRLRNVGSAPIKIIAIEDNFGTQYLTGTSVVLKPGQEQLLTLGATPADTTIDYAGMTIEVRIQLSDGTTVPISVYVEPA